MIAAWSTRGALVVLLALAVPGWWRETNSHASSSRGERAFAGKAYPAAVAAFLRAHEIRPSARTAFNLGTAQIAAGDRARGSATLATALQDPPLRADALFNRGSSALGAGVLDHAIRDFTDALRSDPGHAAAKRNLEIALSQKERQRQSQKGGDGGRQNDASTKPTASPEGDRPKEGEIDMEALLRSVQQQEQEELRRMKGKTGRGGVGW